MTIENDNKEQSSPRRYFARPDAGEKPLSLREIIVIVLATHLGVRSRKQREEDFRRANGFHLFLAGIFYFAIIISGLIVLVRSVTH